MADADTDRNLLFGVLAMQQDLIDTGQFADACAGWAVRKDKPLAEILIERGWITAVDRRDVERFLERKLKRHGGDVRASLAAVADVAARDAIRAVDDSEVRNSLSALPPAAGYVLVETLVPPVQRHSRYRLTRLHAEGGLGRVWLAHDGDLNRDVALKEIRTDRAGHPEAWRRFLKEAQITGQLEHPGIVPVYELARRPEDDQPFYTMRFVKGGTLRQAIADHHARPATEKAGPLDRFKLLQSFVAVCQAIGYAHSRGVIHRDLKPQNVVLDDYGVVMVLDWGLARMVDRSDEDVEIRPDVLVTDEANAHATVPNALLGTPAYMAPEQAEGRNDLVDARTDVYGLGAILFEILTGHMPHEGTNTAELLHQIATGETPRARKVDPSVPPALDAVCAKAMARSRNERYVSASDLAEEVQRWVADEPVRAWREPWPQRLSRWARRNRSWVAAAAGTLVFVSIVSSLAAILIDGARRQTRASLAAESIARAEAGRRLIQARESIDTLLTGVAEGLAQIPGAQKVRRNLLEKAAMQYRQLATEKGDDPALRFESGSAYARLGTIRVQLGDFAGAESDFRAAESALSGMTRSAGDFQVSLTLGQARGNLGEALANQGQFGDAEKAYRGAIDDGQAMLKVRPDDAKSSYLLGAARHKLAQMLTDSKRVAEAEDLFRSAVTDLEAAARTGEYRPRDQLAGALNGYALLLRKLGRNADSETRSRASIATALETVRLFPEEFAARSQLAISQRNLASLLDHIGRSDEAERLYLTSLAEREAVARANPDVPIYRVFRASSRSGLGGFYKRRNRYREAEEADRAAIADFQTLVQDHPDNPDYRDRLALMRMDLGDLFMELGRNPDADAEVRLANDELRALWDANPTVLKYGASFGNGLNNRARILRRLGRLDEAEAVFRAGRDVYERLAKEEPAVPGHRDMLALISNNLAGLLARRFQFAPALPMARRAVTEYEMLTKDHPTVLVYAESMVMSRETLGQVLVNLGSKEEALHVLSAAVAAAEILVSSHPDKPLFLQRLIESRTGLAGVEASLGRFDRAVATLERASRRLQEAVTRHPNSAEFRVLVWEVASTRADILLKQGRPAQAVEGLETLSGEPCPEGVSYYNVACLYTRAAKMTLDDPHASAEPAQEARTRNYNNRAIDILRKAVAMGFRDVKQFAQDRDLDPVRNRPDFQLLMMDVAFPVQPFAR